MSTLKRIARACVITGLCAVIALWLCSFFSGSVVRDTPFTRELNQVSRLATKLVRSELPLPKGQESKRIDAFVMVGILSTNDAAYIREHGIKFLGFDGTRTGADIPIFEGVCKINNFKLEELNVGTTAENLRAAIKGESYERDTMYPEFMALAKKDEAKPAIRTLLYAQKAEAEHAKLYQDALDNLGKSADLPLYVCKVCGYTVTKLPDKNCVSCREPVSNYELIK